jgi:carbon-monoxide dehydrogenase iron sulfur subunit
MNAISVLPDLCTGCQSCEMVCSLSHEGFCSPSFSRIQVQKWGEIAVWIAIVCQHCTNAPCITICPTRSRKRVPETQAVITDTEWCVGCKSCLYACPYGALVIYPTTGKTMTCDLCGGKPLCVDACTVGALSLASEGKVSAEKRKLFAQKVSQAFRAGG